MTSELDEIFNRINKITGTEKTYSEEDLKNIIIRLVEQNRKLDIKIAELETKLKILKEEYETFEYKRKNNEG